LQGTLKPSAKGCGQAPEFHVRYPDETFRVIKSVDFSDDFGVAGQVDFDRNATEPVESCQKPCPERCIGHAIPPLVALNVSADDVAEKEEVREEGF
jgi:hypothetical protein